MNLCVYLHTHIANHLGLCNKLQVHKCLMLDCPVNSRLDYFKLASFDTLPIAKSILSNDPNGLDISSVLCVPKRPTVRPFSREKYWFGPLLFGRHILTDASWKLAIYNAPHAGTSTLTSHSISVCYRWHCRGVNLISVSDNGSIKVMILISNLSLLVKDLRFKAI